MACTSGLSVGYSGRRLWKRGHPGLVIWIRGDVTPLVILDEQPEHIHAKTIDAAIEPETQHIMHCRDNVGVTPIEVGLFLQKGMVIILSRTLVPLPSAATKVT